MLSITFAFELCFVLPQFFCNSFLKLVAIRLYILFPGYDFWLILSWNKPSIIRNKLLQIEKCSSKNFRLLNKFDSVVSQAIIDLCFGLWRDSS